MKQLCRACLDGDLSHSHQLTLPEIEEIETADTVSFGQTSTGGIQTPDDLDKFNDTLILASTPELARDTFLTYNPTDQLNVCKVYVKDNDIITRPSQSNLTYEAISQRFDAWLKEANITSTTLGRCGEVYSHSIGTNTVAQEDIVIPLQSQILFVECLPISIKYRFDIITNCLIILKGTPLTHTNANGENFIKVVVNYLTTSKEDKVAIYIAESKNIRCTQTYLKSLRFEHICIKDTSRAIISQQISCKEDLEKINKDLSAIPNLSKLPNECDLTYAAIQMLKKQLNEDYSALTETKVLRAEPPLHQNSFLTLSQDTSNKLNNIFTNWLGEEINITQNKGIDKLLDKLDFLLDAERSSDIECEKEALKFIEVVCQTMLSSDLVSNNDKSKVLLQEIIDLIKKDTFKDISYSQMASLFGLFNSYCHQLELPDVLADLVFDGNILNDLGLNPEKSVLSSWNDLREDQEYEISTQPPPNNVNVSFTVIIGNKRVPVSLHLEDKMVFREFQEFITMLTQDYSLMNVNKNVQKNAYVDVPSLGEELAKAQAETKSLKEKLAQEQEVCGIINKQNKEAILGIDKLRSYLEKSYPTEFPMGKVETVETAIDFLGQRSEIKEERDHLKKQIDCLADYILKYHSDAIVDGGAVDTAIGLLEKLPKPIEKQPEISQEELTREIEKQLAEQHEKEQKKYSAINGETLLSDVEVNKIIDIPITSGYIDVFSNQAEKINELTAELDKLKKEILALKTEKIEGMLFQAAITSEKVEQTFTTYIAGDDPIIDQRFDAFLPEDQYGLKSIETFGQEDKLNEFCLKEHISYEYYIENMDDFNAQINSLVEMVSKQYQLCRDKSDYGFRYKQVIISEVSKKFNSLVAKIYKLPLDQRSQASLRIQEAKQVVVALNKYLTTIQKPQVKFSGGFKRDKEAIMPWAFRANEMPKPTSSFLKNGQEGITNWEETSKEIQNIVMDYVQNSQIVDEEHIEKNNAHDQEIFTIRHQAIEQKIKTLKQQYKKSPSFDLSLVKEVLSTTTQSLKNPVPYTISDLILSIIDVEETIELKAERLASCLFYLVDFEETKTFDITKLDKNLYEYWLTHAYPKPKKDILNEIMCWVEAYLDSDICFNLYFNNLKIKKYSLSQKDEFEVIKKTILTKYSIEEIKNMTKEEEVEAKNTIFASLKDGKKSNELNQLIDRIQYTFIFIKKSI